MFQECIIKGLVVGALLGTTLAANARTVQNSLADLQSSDKAVNLSASLEITSLVRGMIVEGVMHRRAGTPATDTAICLADKFELLNGAATVLVVEETLRLAVVGNPKVATGNMAGVLWYALTQRYCSNRQSQQSPR